MGLWGVEYILAVVGTGGPVKRRNVIWPRRPMGRRARTAASDWSTLAAAAGVPPADGRAATREPA
eukprot:964972-Prorocentrum_minimum.AAC.1